MVFLKMQQLLQETKLSTAGDKSVFKSLAVDRHSKTPYSDATQVGLVIGQLTSLTSFLAEEEQSIVTYVCVCNCHTGWYFSGLSLAVRHTLFGL